MAGLIARLFGGKPSPALEMEPAPGIGGYNLGAGPANQTGFPGSTKQTRTFPSNGRVPYSPRSAKIRGDSDTDANSRSGTAPEVRQVSYRGDVSGANTRNPRNTSSVAPPQTAIRQEMQANSRAEFYGGPALKTGFANDTAGGQPLGTAQAAGGHSVIDTTTPYSRAQPVINAGGAPGSENVRNQIAQRYKNPAGQLHAYKSAPRPDTAPVNRGGQNTDGNVHPEAVVQTVIVPNRAVLPEITWSVTREMPYGGRGNGARGADLNGQRYYATGQADQFFNAGRGDYGMARALGGDNKRPVSFSQPAPWSASFYDTTESIGTNQDPNQQPAQQPQAIYYSPGGLRASNRTGRTG